MSLESLIGHYGYLFILVGTFLEGETTLILGAMAAKLGYLELPWVIVCAFVGTLCGDQLAFIAGRYWGQRLLRRFPKWNEHADRVEKIIRRYSFVAIFGFRFVYGTRIVTPFVIGAGRFPVTIFLAINAASAAVWASTVGLLGYLFGHGLELIWGDVRRYEIVVFGLAATMGLAVWIVRASRALKKCGRR